ncbi:hypothetical protein [Bradyrhizobium monzae]|uniref:hypothetical protein n=1 Tax=Bradyrhizobium sp. Oc8 TaxID=2876780 RepID=UPI001F38A03A|nr:hypothetical protein [Bradyrhizobium sp. Oc8]
MTSVSTDGHAGSQAQSSLLRKASDQVFARTFLITSAVATLAWFYGLAQGAVTIANWLFP